jgi:hypothetical protein
MALEPTLDEKADDEEEDRASGDARRNALHETVPSEEVGNGNERTLSFTARAARESSPQS